MGILKAVVAIEGEASLSIADAIQHEGKTWIVPTWKEDPIAGSKKPERIVQIDNLQHQKLDPSQGFPADFAVNSPIPKAVLYGPLPISADSGYIVIPNPEILVPIPRGIH